MRQLLLLFDEMSRRRWLLRRSKKVEIDEVWDKLGLNFPLRSFSTTPSKVV